MVLTEDEYRALLKVAGRLDWRFGVALVLAHETGQRILSSPHRGRKSSKVLQDRTICVFCRWGRCDFGVSKQPECSMKRRESGVDRVRAQFGHRENPTRAAVGAVLRPRSKIG